MNTLSKDRELYLSYRLRELPPEERDAIDDRLLADDGFSDRMQEAEYDLLDDYRADRLTSDVRLQVERAFSRDELRHPLSFTPRKNGAHATLLSRLAPQFSLASGLACAMAAFVLIAVAGWVTVDRLPSGAVSPTLASRTPPVPSSLPQDSGKSSTRIAVSSSQLPGETAVLLLAPAVTRGGSTSQLELRPLTRTVTVQWLVPSDLTGRTFSLLVQQNGKDVALVPASNVQRIGGSVVEEFSLPRTVFSAVGPHVRYVFLVRKSGAAPATEAEVAVHVSENFSR